MNKQEALKLAIDGKKVRAVEWLPDLYLKFNSNGFEVWENESFYKANPYLNYDEWELFEEPPTYVDFPTAMKAFIEKKTTVESFGGLYRYIDGEDYIFSMEEMKSKKWVVHD